MGGAACPSLRERRIIKAAFALHSAIHAALEGHRALYVSVGQAPFELLDRIFCKELARPIADYWNRDPSYLAGAREVAPRLPLSRLFLRSDPAVVIDEEGTVGRIRRWATRSPRPPSGCRS